MSSSRKRFVTVVPLVHVNRRSRDNRSVAGSTTPTTESNIYSEYRTRDLWKKRTFANAVHTVSLHRSGGERNRNTVRMRGNGVQSVNEEKGATEARSRLVRPLAPYWKHLPHIVVRDRSCSFRLFLAVSCLRCWLCTRTRTRTRVQLLFSVVIRLRLHLV